LTRGFLVTVDAQLGAMGEGDIVEVTDYDPVRKTSIVIGMREPSAYVPLHWLALRTHPELLCSLLIITDKVPAGVKVFSSTLLPGSFEEAMEVAKALKASKRDVIFLENRGLFLVARDLDGLVARLKAVLSGKEAKKKKRKKKPKKKSKKRRSKRKGKGTRKKERKVTRRATRKGVRERSSRRKPSRKRRVSKRKTHYKRGPTRRTAPRRR
jgi:hypothetical protein